MYTHSVGTMQNFFSVAAGNVYKYHCASEGQ